MPERCGTGRIYLEPEPERGAHPGYRGPLRADELGVHVSQACEHLVVDTDGAAPGEWPMGEWCGLDSEITVPWHRIVVVEWGEHHAVALDAPADAGAAASGDAGPPDDERNRTAASP